MPLYTSLAADSQLMGFSMSHFTDDADVDSSSKLQMSLRTKDTLDKYPAKSHAQRVASKLGFDKALIVLQGERKALFSNSDQARPFRQDRYFYYLSGCNEPDCFVTYNTEKDRLTLWLPSINYDRVFYDGRGSTVEEATEKYDIDEAIYITGNGTQSNVTRLMTNHHDTSGQCFFMPSVTAVLNQPLRIKLKGSGMPGFRLRRAMDACRAVKDEHEIALIRKANDVSTKAHSNILKQLHRLNSERRVEAAYLSSCIAHGAKEQSYGPICGSGPNASQLHYMANNEKFGDRQVLLVDAGAEWACYASDVTRTMPINPKHPGTWQSKEAAEIYKAVERIQEECISLLKPGKHFMDVVFHSIHMAIDALRELGILKGDHMEIFHDGVAAGIYPHGLGHHLGLEVHDVFPPIEGKVFPAKKVGLAKDVQQAYARFAKALPKLAAQTTSDEPEAYSINPSMYRSPSLPLDAPLEAGMVVTVEPGLYFNAFVLEKYYLNDKKHRKFINKDVLARYMHVGGVRIEDDILITKDGYENLTTAPKGEKMLKIMREAAGEKS